MGEVVLLWIATTSEGIPVIEEGAAKRGLRIVRCAARDLHLHTLASSSPLPVIAVVDDDRAATEALGAGVDEVVRQGELTAEELDRAVVRAEARALARARAMDPTRVGDESDAMASLLDWIAIELVACMSGAILEGELLEESVRRLLAERAARGEQREAVPSATDTLEMLDTVRESFSRMQSVLNAVRDLSGYEATSTPIAPLFAALSRLLLNRAIPVGDIEIQADPTCATTVRTAKLVGALVPLLSNVFDRAARVKRPRGERVHIVLRAFVAEDVVIMEIEDDVGDLAREAANVTWRVDPIAEVRSRLREEGVEVLVSAVPGRTTVRLVLPLGEYVAPLPDDSLMIDPLSRPN